MDDSATSTKTVQGNIHFPPEGKQRGKPSSNRRMSNFRERKSNETMEAIHAAARARTTVGIDNFLETFNNLKLQPVPTAVCVPVTSRGLGFNVLHDYNNVIDRFPKAKNTSVNTVYRVALGQYEAQLHESEHRGLSFNEHVAVQPSTMDAQMLSAIRTNCKNLLGVAATINQLGEFKHDHKHFRTTMLAPVTSSEPRGTKRARVSGFTPDPYRVNLSNLRATVDYLSSGQTDPAVRQYFIDRNPIPGAVYVNNLLTNPDDIITQGYSSSNMLRDTSIFKNFLSHIKDRRFVQEVKLDGVGNPAALVTARYNNSFIHGDELFVQDDNDLYCSENIEHGFIVSGILGLVGETVRDGPGSRSGASAVQSYDTAWYTIRTDVDPN